MSNDQYEACWEHTSKDCNTCAELSCPYHVKPLSSQKELSNEDKYHWHNLQKNSSDLPDEFTKVIAIVRTEDEVGGIWYSKTFARCIDGKWRESCCYAPNNEIDEPIVAWKYSEPYMIYKEVEQSERGKI